jgi:hydroxyethylthiazole kinase-like sugar kinase family protein
MVNLAKAAPVVTFATNSVVSTSTARVVNLNFATPTLSFTQQQINSIKNLLGCKCATCMKASQM